MIQQEALQKTNVADKSFFKRISPERESRKTRKANGYAGLWLRGPDLN